MIKNLKKTDICVRPFQTFKTWNINNQKSSNVLLTECGCPVFICYAPSNETGSREVLVESSSLNLVPIRVQEFVTESFLSFQQRCFPKFCTVTNEIYNSCSMDLVPVTESYPVIQTVYHLEVSKSFVYEQQSGPGCCDFNRNYPTYSIALETQQYLNNIKIIEGISGSGVFYPSDSKYYNNNDNPLNWDGTYKRSIYSTIDHMFYRYQTNPMELFGLEHLDKNIDGKKENRYINNRIIMANLPYGLYGEKIKPESVYLVDNSNPHESYVIQDDGYTNLYITNKPFYNVDELSAPLALPSSSYYNPLDDSGFPGLYASSSFVLSSSLEIISSSLSFGASSSIQLSTSFQWSSSYNKCGFEETRTLVPSQSATITYFDSDNNPTLSRSVNIPSASFYLKNSLIPSSSYHFGHNAIAERWSYDLTKQREFYDVTNNGTGEAVATWGDYVLVGAPMNSESFSNSKTGNAYIYKFDSSTDSFRYIKKFYSPWTQNAGAEEFGIDNSILIGTELGFLLNMNEWSANDRFGSAVDINDGFMAIGSPLANFCAVDAPETGSFNDKPGFVFVYDKYKGGSDHWGIINIIQGAEVGDEFGHAVSLKSDVLAIGAPGRRDKSGAVYVFRRRVLGDTAPMPEYFHQLSLEEDRCSVYTNENLTSYPNYFKISSEDDECQEIIDELGDELVDESTFSGSLYLDDIYDERSSPYFLKGDNTWILEQVITAPDSASFEYFGGSLDTDGNRIIIGNSKNAASSSAYLFEYGTGSLTPTSCSQWNFICKFTGSINDKSDLIFFNTPVYPIFNDVDHFGHDVSIDGNYIIIGSPTDRKFKEYASSTNVYHSGAVYVYKKTPEVIATLDGCACSSCPPCESGLCDWSFIQKVYGRDSDSRNNNFGQSVAIRNNRFIVGALFGKQSINVSYDGPLVDGYAAAEFYDVEDLDQKSTGPTDETNVEGRAYIYKLNGTWEIEKVIKRSKLENVPKHSYGWDVAISTDIAVVGSPLFFTKSSSLDEPFHDQNMLRYGLSPYYSGSAYVYSLQDLDRQVQTGNVFYKNGTFVLTETGSLFKDILTNSGSRGFDLTYQGTHTIFEHEVLCSLSPGEFNASTNPSALVSKRIVYDVNNDGVFDEQDVDLILRYLSRFKRFTQGFILEDDNAIINEKDTLLDESWWNNDAILSESEDVIYVGDIIDKVSADRELQAGVSRLSTDIFEYLTFLDNNGDLDINFDGIADAYDGKILLNFFIGQLDDSLLEGALTRNSERRFTVDIIDFLVKRTGRTESNIINSNFINYFESSSLDKTGSYLAPYVTSIGLYSPDNELLAIAKLGKPIKNVSEYPINFLVRFDS